MFLSWEQLLASELLIDVLENGQVGFEYVVYRLSPAYASPPLLSR
jgi:hypothetical protein